MKRIFIDGVKGTTALQIKTLLKPFIEARTIDLLTIEDTRNSSQRGQAHKNADLSILCLPDGAAKDTVEMMEGIETKIIDASSAHRTDPNWIYGFPELNKGQPSLIKNASRVSNPGCYATGAISILAPLVSAGMIKPESTQTILGVSGYTGGGKSLVETYEVGDGNFSAAHVFTQYSLGSEHKHVAEIRKHTGLSSTPIFIPNVVNQPRGMIVSIPFNRASLNGDIKDVHRVLEDAYSYEGSMVTVHPIDTNQKSINFLSFSKINTGDTVPIPNVDIHVTGWKNGDDNQVTVHALLDNLGKGAGAQVVQNMKLMLGIS